VRVGRRSLRVAPGLPVPAELDPFAVVTAYNPASGTIRTDLNRTALRALRAELDATGRRWLPARAHGSGPDARRWAEPGFALLGSGVRAAAVALGAGLGQNAVLVGAPGQPPLLVATRAGFCGRRVGDVL
jgi:hypothetical protein